MQYVPITPDAESAHFSSGPTRYDVISIQSQVVYGCVGNSIAVPAMAQHGLRVALVPTVILSNTPHYPSCYGGKIPVEWFEGFLQGLLERGALTHVRAIVIGYIGTTTLVSPLVAWLKQVRALRADIQIILDPVMGDTDCGYYVNAEINACYRDELLPLASGLTPNAFELSCLSAMTLDNTESVIAAARSLLKGAVQWVVVTSAPGQLDKQHIQALCVTREDAVPILHNRLPISPKGTGDLFCAELTAALLQDKSPAQAAAHACHQVELSVLKTQLSESEELCLAPLA